MNTSTPLGCSYFTGIRADTNESILIEESCLKLQLDLQNADKDQSFKKQMDKFKQHKELSQDQIHISWQIIENKCSQKNLQQHEIDENMKKKKCNSASMIDYFPDQQRQNKNSHIEEQDNDIGTLNSLSLNRQGKSLQLQGDKRSCQFQRKIIFHGGLKLPLGLYSGLSGLSSPKTMKNQNQGFTQSLLQNCGSDIPPFHETGRDKASNLIELLSGKEKKGSKRNFLKQIYYIRRITNALKSRLNKQRLSQLKQIHFNIINDQSHFYELPKPSLKLKMFQDINSIIFKHIGVFSPDSLPIMACNTIILLMQVLQLVIYPLRSAFQIDLISQGEQDLIYKIPLILGIVEMIINANNSFYEHGILVTQHNKIFQRYIITKFPFDIITLGILYIGMNTSSFILDILFAITSLNKMFFNLKSINEHFQIEQRFQTTYDLTTLTWFVFYMAHYCACGFYFVGTLTVGGNEMSNNKNQISWIEHYNFQNLHWMNNYINSLYFTFITMGTVGYGDIAPANIIEKFLVAYLPTPSIQLEEYFLTLLFVWLLTSKYILMKHKERNGLKRNRKFEITKFMRLRNITTKTQRKVLKYIEYEYGQQQESYQKGEEILQQISKSLREEVNREYFGKFINDIKLFRLNFSTEFLMHLSSHIKERTYGPNEIIFTEGDLDRNFYFVCRGQVQLYLNSKNSHHISDEFDLISVGKGQLLGLNSFMTGNPKDMSAKCINSCHLIYCSENDFVNTISEHESDYEKYCMLKDQINLLKDHQGLPCMSCGKFDHQARNCTLFNLRIDKESVNLRHIYSPLQERNEFFIRKSTKGFQSLACRQRNCMSLRKLRIDYIKILYDISSSSDDSSQNSKKEIALSFASQNSSGQVIGKEEQESLMKQLTQVSNVEKNAIQLKSDRDFFIAVRLLKARDLRQYFRSMGEIAISEDKLKNLSEDNSNSEDTETASIQFEDEDQDNGQHNSIESPISINKRTEKKNLTIKDHFLLRCTEKKPSKNPEFDIQAKTGLKSSAGVINSDLENVFGAFQSNHSIKIKEEDHEMQLVKLQKKNSSYENESKNNQPSPNKKKTLLMHHQQQQQFLYSKSLIKSKIGQAEEIRNASQSLIGPQVNVQQLNNQTYQDGHQIKLPDKRKGSRHSTTIARSSQNQMNYEFPQNYSDIFQRFDKYKEFTYFFPNFNISLVLKEHRKKTYQISMLNRINKLTNTISNQKPHKKDNRNSQIIEQSSNLRDKLR